MKTRSRRFRKAAVKISSYKRKRDVKQMLEDLKRILADLLNHEREIRDSL